MMDIFRKRGVWLKGNLHCHSTVSDGKQTPRELVNGYKAAGYDFLSITDHERLMDTTNLDGDGIILIPGEEVSWYDYTGTNDTTIETPWHILAINIKREIKNGQELGAQRIIDEIARQGGLAFIAHPYEVPLSCADLWKVNGYCGIEVYNGGTYANKGRGFAQVYWDILFRMGRQVYGIATDDLHGLKPIRQNAINAAWIMVKTEDHSVSGIMKSIANGDFYSSTGPEIKDLTVSNNKIVVHTSPVKSITIITNNWELRNQGSRYWAENGKTLEHCEHDLKDSLNIRVECQTEDDRWCWSNWVACR